MQTYAHRSSGHPIQPLYQKLESEKNQRGQKNMKLVVGVCLLSGLALVVLYGIVMGVMVTGWQHSVDDLWTVAAEQTRTAMMQVVNDTLSFTQFVAESVPQLDHILRNNSNHDPTALLRAFAAFNQFSGYQLSSMGFLQHATPPRPASAKVSWQIARGFGCPSYMYAYSDDLINPQFVGYCGEANGFVNYTNPPAYVGADWGLKPQEIALLNGSAGSTGLFLPVFDLLGAFTLTYETVYPPPRSGLVPWAVTFAELDLTMLCDYIHTHIRLLDGKAFAFIYETQSGAMIASTINGTLFASNRTRYTVYNNPNEWIRQTADGAEPGWLVTLTQRTEPGLNWTVIVAASESNVKGNIQTGIVVGSVACLCVLIALVLLTWLGMSCCVVRQLNAKKQGSVSIPYTVFDEIK
jgi:uncharacterized membrane protein